MGFDRIDRINRIVLGCVHNCWLAVKGRYVLGSWALDVREGLCLL